MENSEADCFSNILCVNNVVAARRVAGPQVEAERASHLRPPVSGRQATAEVGR